MRAMVYLETKWPGYVSMFPFMFVRGTSSMSVALFVEGLVLRKL